MTVEDVIAPRALENRKDQLAALASHLAKRDGKKLIAGMTDIFGGRWLDRGSPARLGEQERSNV